MNIMVWGSFCYMCHECGFEKRMHLEVGVEGPGSQKKMPCPFCIICPNCGGLTLRHVDWFRDESFPPRRLLKGESYFKLSKSKNEFACGKPVFPPKPKEGKRME